jgi:opacity protein-like surface antigen
MRLAVPIIAALLLLAGLAQAADVPTDKGDKALMFIFSGLDDLALEGFGGHYGAGLRYYISNGMALRAAVTAGTQGTVVEADEEGWADWEYSNTEYGLHAGLEMHMEGPCGSVSPYYGGGASFSSMKEETISPTGDDGSTETCTDERSGFGGYAMVGFEWAFTDCMTLGGEYKLGYWKSTQETTEERGDKTDYTSTGFRTYSVYLSVYW